MMSAAFEPQLKCHQLTTNCHNVSVRRCRTGGGILGEDRRLRESPSGWETEHKFRFHPKKALNQVDWRQHHKPHICLARHIQHLHGRKPVCTVKTLLSDAPECKRTEPSYYNITYRHRKPVEPKVVISAQQYARTADGILPFNSDARPERLLPVCDMLRVPSGQNYFSRRRKVESPYKDEGVFYSNRSSMIQESEREKIKCRISSTGDILGRRRFVSPPKPILDVKNFDGGAPATYCPPFYMQFLRSKTII